MQLKSSRQGVIYREQNFGWRQREVPDIEVRDRGKNNVCLVEMFKELGKWFEKDVQDREQSRQIESIAFVTLKKTRKIYVLQPGGN